MSQTKQRVVQKPNPAYPQLSEARIERRGFLALLGGTATLTILGACVPPLGGAVAEPGLYSLRLPQTDGHTTYLLDGSYLSYIVWTQHENRFFNAYAIDNSKDVFVALDALLQRYNYSSLADKATITKLGWSIRTELEDLFMKAKGEDAHFSSVRLEVVRLQKQEQPMGAAPYPEHP